MRYASVYKSNRAISRRSTTAGQWAADWIQGSGKSIANCKLRKAQPSPPTPLPKVEGTFGPCKTASGLERNSSFILHPSSFRSNPSSSISHHPRRGVTLVEMLIVISIIMIMLVITLRVMPSTEDRRTREAARSVNVYLSSARNRAIEIGRPCGVIFKRALNTNFSSASMILNQCEVPPPYAGDTMNAVVKVQNTTINPLFPRFAIKLRAGDFSNQLIRPGDLIQLNNQGPFYTVWLLDSITKPPPPPDYPPDITTNYFQFSGLTPPELDSDGDGFIDNYQLTLTLNPQETQMQALPWPTQASGQWSSLVPFQILRQPDQVPSSNSSLQLPAGTVVDLFFSGTDNQLFAGDDVKIIFSNNGAVEGYYLNGKQPVTGPIFLLIGSSSRARNYATDPLPASPNQKELPNWTDMSNLWITINHQTGLIATSENSSYTGAPDWTAPGAWLPFVNQSRNIARQAQSMGGR
jgi:type II secretory pathway pseudopilin PulG